MRPCRMKAYFARQPFGGEIAALVFEQTVARHDRAERAHKPRANMKRVVSGVALLHAALIENELTIGDDAQTSIALGFVDQFQAPDLDRFAFGHHDLRPGSQAETMIFDDQSRRRYLIDKIIPPAVARRLFAKRPEIQRAVVRLFGKIEELAARQQRVVVTARQIDRRAAPRGGLDASEALSVAQHLQRKEAVGQRHRLFRQAGARRRARFWPRQNKQNHA